MSIVPSKKTGSAGKAKRKLRTPAISISLPPKPLKHCLEHIDVQDGLYNIVLMFPGKRGVCGDVSFALVPGTGEYIRPRKGTEDISMFGPPESGENQQSAGENTGFINYWPGTSLFTSEFLESEYGQKIMKVFDEKALQYFFTTDAGKKLVRERGVTGAREFLKTPEGKQLHPDSICSLGVERAWEQKGKADSVESLQKFLHRDDPRVNNQEKCVKTLPKLYEVSVPIGSYGILILRQNTWHSVPTGGNSMGYFIKPMMPLERKFYVAATYKVIMNQLTKAQLGEQTHIWTKLLLHLNYKYSEKETVQDHIAGSLVFGLRPPSFPSGKKINIPPPYCGKVYKKMRPEGVAPDATKQVLEHANILEKLEAMVNRKVFKAFKYVSTKLPNQKWVVDPTKYGEEYLHRVLDW